MKVSKQVLLSLVATAILVAPAWARLAPTVIAAQSQPSQPSSSQQSPSQPSPAPAATAAVSGKIAAVSASSLSLTIQQGSDAQTQQFVINSDTKIDGTLAVGAMASVEYRTDSGSQIATHITVQSGS